VVADLVEFAGPLGALAPELARRRIAVAADPAGRLCLVRPDSVVVEFDDDGFDAVQQVVADQQLDVLGDGLGDEPPPSRTVAVRPAAAERPVGRPERWGMDVLHRLMDRVRSDRYEVRPNQVYLADGVARHFGRLGGTGSAGTPGFTNPADVSSTAKPAAAPAHLPEPLRIPGRRAPHVLVLDTGLRTYDSRAEHPWLRDHCVIHRPWRDLATVGRWDDEDEPDDDRRGRLDQQAGHGTFITGIVRQTCPDAVIHHRGVLTSYGDGDDASVIAAIERAVRATPDDIDIVVMAFGTYGTDDQPPPMTGAIRRLPRTALVVASAGNDGTARPYFPAALPDVIAVGALDTDGRATFSNFGSWVDACTPGVDVVSTFFTQFDDRCSCCGSIVDEYRGWARWSGTSVCAPKVAGAIAQEMYVHDGSAAEAWDRLTGPGRHRVPDLGVVFNA
jgi:hypothetical protein